ncbi:MAG: hypothetical protein AAF376_04530 [Pseudomonadota bacterium]
MRIAPLLAVIAFLTIPSLAAAECSWGLSQEANISCADGTTWDAETQACTPVVSS